MYPCVSFDLDNTLYDYDANANRAVEAVFSMLKSSRGLSRDRLWEAYTQFLRRIPGPRLFSDGRTSYEYRKERFGEVLGLFGIRDEDLLEECVSTYSGTLVEQMIPYPEVQGVLRRLSRERKVLVITDAPRDVQERILSVLGIDGFVSGLFTPTSQGNIKEDGGLYLEALGECAVAPVDVLHFGDSYLRDVLGARRAGVRGVLVKRETGLMTELVRMHEGGGLEPEDAEAVDDLEGVYSFF